MIFLFSWWVISQVGEDVYVFRWDGEPGDQKSGHYGIFDPSGGVKIPPSEDKQLEAEGKWWFWLEDDFLLFQGCSVFSGSMLTFRGVAEHAVRLEDVFGLFRWNNSLVTPWHFFWISNGSVDMKMCKMCSERLFLCLEPSCMAMNRWYNDLEPQPCQNRPEFVLFVNLGFLASPNSTTSSQQTEKNNIPWNVQFQASLHEQWKKKQVVLG